MLYAKFAAKIGENNVLTSEPLSRHTTLRIGGPADYMLMPRTERDIASVLSVCRTCEIPYVLIGNGSNLLFDDRGYRGAVIRLTDNYSGITETDDPGTFYARAGTALSRVSSYACEHVLTGFEFASGIPGSVGGAVLMNAGAYEGEMAQCTVRTRYIDVARLDAGNPDFVRERTAAEHDFSYRHSVYQTEQNVVLGAFFSLRPAESRDAVASRIRVLNSRRREKQPLEYPSAGSAFKRPAGDFAARLIELCGLRGYRVGDAMVSEKHCGFIVNVGRASCSDVLHVIEYVRERVLAQTGTLLEPEIKIIREG